MCYVLYDKNLKCDILGQRMYTPDTTIKFAGLRAANLKGEMPHTRGLKHYEMWIFTDQIMQM